jgi:hypothetical protein
MGFSVLTTDTWIRKLKHTSLRASRSYPAVLVGYLVGSALPQHMRRCAGGSPAEASLIDQGITISAASGHHQHSHYFPPVTAVPLAAYRQTEAPLRVLRIKSDALACVPLSCSAVPTITLGAPHSEAAWQPSRLHAHCNTALLAAVASGQARPAVCSFPAACKATKENVLHEAGSHATCCRSTLGRQRPGTCSPTTHHSPGLWAV